MNNTKKTKGIGLLELVIYVALLAILTVGAVNAIIAAYTVMTRARLERAVNTEGELAMQRIIREIRNAYDIDTGNSIFNAHPGALRLLTYADAAGSIETTADIRVTSNLLHLNKATTSVDLTSATSIDSLVFRNLNPTTTPKAVRVELMLTASSSRFMIERSFYGTATLRGSY